MSNCRQGQNISLVASELLASILEWEEQDLEGAIEGIQKGLDIVKFLAFTG